MEDLLEELLNVLAEPSRREITHPSASDAKQLATNHGTSDRQSQINELSASPDSQQQADRAMENQESADVLSGLMSIASLSEAASRPSQTTRSSATPEEALVKSLLFDAGIAVSDLNGHQTFYVQNEQTETPIEEAKQLPNRVRVFVNQQSESAYVTVVEDPKVEDPKVEDPEDEAIAEPNNTESDVAFLENEEEVGEIEANESNAFEMSAAEIDESVMSAFDIGDFEADAHAVQAEDKTASKVLSNRADDSGRSTSDFEPDDLDIEIADLYDLNHRKADTEVPEDEFYDEDDGIDLSLETSTKPLIGSVADISPDEIEEDRKLNIVARWFQRWLNPIEEELSDQFSEPKLFEDSYKAEADTDAYSDLEAIDEVAFEPEMIPEPPEDEGNEVAVDAYSAEASEVLEVSEISEAPETIEIFESADAFEIEATLPIEDPLPVKSAQDDVFTTLETEKPETPESSEAADETLEPETAEISEPIEDTDAAATETIELFEAEDEEATERFAAKDEEAAETIELFEAEDENTADSVASSGEAIALTADETIEPAASETTVSVQAVPLESALIEDLSLFEPDDSDEEALLEALGEKSWLTPTDNANVALHTAAAAGDLSGIWAALEANASVNTLSETQRTALSVAVEAGHLPAVRMLLEMCADPNLADIANGSPASYPLMVAASRTTEPVRGDMVQLLIASGASVNQANVMGQTALMGAAEKGHLDALQLLLEANASLDAQDLLGQSAIAHAKKREQTAVVEFLQRTALEREEAIAFLRAVTRGDLAEVQQWLAAGISANTRVARMSALTQAAAKGEVAIAQLLIEAGADINYQFHPNDPTPLLHAAYRGQAKMVSLLLEAGASTHPTPNAAIGALDYAEIGQKKASNPEAFEPAIALLATLAKRP